MRATARVAVPSILPTVAVFLVALVVAGGTDSEELVVILDFGSIILKEGLLFDHPAGTTMEYAGRTPPPPSTPSEEDESTD